MSTIDTNDEELRHRAIEQLEKRSEFVRHILAYALVHAVLVTIWFATGRGFFWPVFSLLGWGIGVFFHGMDTFRRPYTEERIRREMDRLS